MEEVNLALIETLRLIASDNRDAFRNFYDLFYIRTYRFAHYFIQNKEDCDEIVSDVFFNIWEKRHSLSQIENIEAYMYTMCRNESYRRLKRNQKYQHISIDDMPVELGPQSANVENRMIEQEMDSMYKEAVATLPERCKLIFLMVREEKLKHKEIARILSITEGTIEAQMNIAIKKIMSVVQQQYPSLKR